MVYQSDPEPGRKVGFGGPSLGRSPDAQKQRRPVNQEQIEFSGETGSTQLLEQGFGPALFFRQRARRSMTAIAASTNPIERSFELAAISCEDLTPLVYRRLHAERPETLTMFRSDGSELVKGSMLAMTIEAILDFAGPRHGKFRMIECEVVSHDAYGTPRELFVIFFGVIARTLQEVLGNAWTPDIDTAWCNLQGEIGAMVAEVT
jgi:hemoglobin-like flavoprotein